MLVFGVAARKKKVLLYPATTALLHTISTLPSVPAGRLLLVRHLDALPQALDDERLAGDALVDVPDVVGGALEVAGGVVALGDEDVVGGAVVEGLVDGDGRALC
jgi:hypothetical protein